MKRTKVTDRFTFKQTPIGGKKVALVIRVSQEEYVKTADGQKEHRASVQAQTQDAIAWAKQQGWAYEVYDEDCNVSGGEDIANRPALQRLIKDIEAGKIHTVYCREASRFCRNEKVWHVLVWDYLYKYGVDFKDNDGTDIKTSSGLMLAGIKAGQNQSFLHENAKRSMRSKVLAAEQGKLRIVPCFGYGIEERDGIRKGYIKETEAEVIRELYERAAKGEGTQVIINDFIARRIKTKRGKHLHAANMIRWLHNPVYKGRIVYNGKEYQSPYPAIVSPELWAKAQISMGERAKRYGIDRRRAANSHLLTGLLKCGYCCDKKDSGQPSAHNIAVNYVAAYNNTWKRNGKGEHTRERYLAYRCQTKYKHHASSCPDSISLKAEYIEAEIATWVGAMIANDYASSLTSGETELAKLSKSIATAEAQAEKLRKAKAGILKLHASGAYSDEEAEQAITANKQALATAEGKLHEERQRRDNLAGAATAEALKSLATWDKMSIEQRKVGLHKLFDSIKVYDDRLVIAYKANPSETVTLPLRFAKQKGIQIDHAKAIADLQRYGQSFRFFRAK